MASPRSRTSHRNWSGRYSSHHNLLPKMGQHLRTLPTQKGNIREPVASISLPLRSTHAEAGRVAASYPVAMLAPVPWSSRISPQ